MSTQPALWLDPPWTDAWPVGTRVTDVYTHTAGTVVEHSEVQGRAGIVVEFESERWGTHRVRYGAAMSLEKT